MKRLFAVLVLAGTSVNAQTITTESFGSGANAFTMDFVSIGNPNNPPDTDGYPPTWAGYGSVSYSYNIGKYEVSRDIITKANLAGGLGLPLADMSVFGGNGANRPATGLGWLSSARFVNWLNTSRGFLPAYKFDGSGNLQLWSAGDVGYNPNNLFRNALAKFVLPTNNEWYKSAFGSPSGIWYDYTTGSNTTPTAVTGGTDPNTAVYGGLVNSPADFDNAGGLSAWGTMAQGGNVGEWMESARDGINNDPNETREQRAGMWGDGSGYLSSTIHFDSGGVGEFGGVGLGLRVVMIPEPSSASLLLVGGLVVLARRKRA